MNGLTGDRGGRASATSAVRRDPVGVVFDLDGVLVDTARIHAAAWKEMFDRFLRERAGGEPFGMDDYRRYVDGRPRYRGVASFLESRGIELPPGDPSDPPGMGTRAGLGNLKNEIFLGLLEESEIRPLDGVEDLLDSLRVESVPVAVVSSSRNADRILPPDLRRHVDQVLGGKDLDRLGLPGKPQPDMFVRAAHEIGLEPGVVAVVEDSTAGVTAARRGGFALVVGVGDADGSSSMRELADIVVEGVSELPSSLSAWPELLRPPPNAFDDLTAIRRRVGEQTAPIYVGNDERELLEVRRRDGVGVVVDPDPSSLTWGDFHVTDEEAAARLLARLDRDHVED